MKKSQYIERYGKVIDFPEESIEMVGKTHILENCQTGEEFKGLITDIRFSEIFFTRGNKKVLGVEFKFDNFTDEPFWSIPFPTEIEKPEISDLHTDDFVKEAFKGINDISKPS